jgi:26S proteasome regulatory subunit N11
MVDLSKKYEKAIQDEQKIDAKKLTILNVGKIDARRHLEDDVEHLMTSNIIQTLGTMLDVVVF